MQLRGKLGIAVALAVGLTLGYTVRPSAQDAGAVSPESHSWMFQSSEQGRIKLTLPADSNGVTRTVEDTQIRVILIGKDLLIFQPVSASATVVPEDRLQRKPDGGLHGFAFRIAK